MNGITFDKDYTHAYRDKYNEPCDCEQCNLFRKKFSNKYPQVVKFLSQFGVNIYFPLEILDIGINNETLKREYIVYYAIKGHLSEQKMSTKIGNVVLTMRNNEIASEAYSNTDMKAPFFVVELRNILLKDNQGVFREAIDVGREIEFSYNGEHYFESRTTDTDWYVYHEKAKMYQYFKSAEDLVANTILQGKNINELWEEISLDCIL